MGDSHGITGKVTGTPGAEAPHPGPDREIGSDTSGAPAAADMSGAPSDVDLAEAETEENA